jgi:N-methylhydantoinase A
MVPRKKDVILISYKTHSHVKNKLPMKRIAVDIGGTFTDIVYLDDGTSSMIADKVRSTPLDISRAVFEAIRKIGAGMHEVELFVHGTTVGLNTVIQQKGAKTGLLTTEGFRDVLEMGRGDRKELYNYLWKKPKPLVPRHLRLGINERTDYLGRILRPVQYVEVQKALQIFKEEGVEAIAVCLLHSYANPENELMTGRIVNSLWPEVDVSLSHQVAREFREFERTSTTVLDAYIKRQVVQYLAMLHEKLAETRFRGQVLIVSPSGVLGLDAVRERAIATFASGPIGGVSGSLPVAQQTGNANLVTMDVGGTSFDVSLVKDYAPIVKHRSELMGYPVLLPGMDIRPIGAGGGSIARVDAGGLLTVGPESAGADPGPMCYGLGGKEPAVTDAALVNGVINPDYFLGGEIRLDLERASKGIAGIADRLGLSVPQAADGILKVSRANMTAATREVLVGQGYDPREFTLISYGGGGGIFAAGIARDLSISRVIIPANPGVFSAWGMLSMDIVHAFSQTFCRAVDTLDIRELNLIYQNMEDRGRAMLRQEGIADGSVDLQRSVDMCYEGQGHYVEVPMPDGKLKEETRAEISRRFHELHEVRYGHRMERTPKTINVRLKAIGRIEKAHPKEQQGTAAIPGNAFKPERKVYWEGQLNLWKVVERNRLLPGNRIAGPAIVEEPHHTTVVWPGQVVIVDGFKNLIIEVPLECGSLLPPCP